MGTKVIKYGPRRREEWLQRPTRLDYVISTDKPTPGYPINGSLAVGGYSGGFTVMDDIVTKDFKRLIRAGVVVNNPMRKSSLETGIPHIDCTTASAGLPVNAIRRYIGDGMGYMCGPLVPADRTLWFGAYPDPPGVNGETCLRAISTSAWKNVNPSSALSLVTLAEAQKSWNLIYGKAQKLAKVIDLFNAKRPWTSVQALLGADVRLARKPKFLPVWHPERGTLRTKHGKARGVWVHEPLTREKWNALDKSTRTWLEWRYGWSPLVKDIVDHLRAVTLPEPWRQRTRHTAWGFFDKEGTVLTTTKGSVTFGGDWYFTTKTFTHVKGRAYVIWELNPGNPFGRLNDFGLFDIPRTVLELIPYSFVAEWFVKTDDFLKAWQPKIGATIVASGSTIKTRKRVDREIISWSHIVQPNGSYWPESPVPVGTVDWFVANAASRVVPLTLPDRPIVDVNLNIKRLVDAFALLKGSVSRSTTRV